MRRADEVVRRVVPDVAPLARDGMLVDHQVDEADRVRERVLEPDLAGPARRGPVSGALARVTGKEHHEVLRVEHARLVVRGRLLALVERDLPAALLVDLERDGRRASGAEGDQPDALDGRPAEAAELGAGKLDDVVASGDRPACPERRGLVRGHSARDGE